MATQAFQWGLNDQSRHLNGASTAAAVALSTQFGLIISGSTVGSALVSTSALTAGDATCAFPTATLAAGDELMIQSSTQLYMDGVSGAVEKRGELVQIASVTDASHFETTEPLRFSYASGATTTAQKVSLLDSPVIDGLTLTMGGTGKVHNGILFDLCRNPIVRNLTIDGCEDTCVQFTRCWGGTVERSTFKNATSPDPGIGTTGYGVAVLDGSRDINIGPGNLFRNCRHGVAGGGTPPAVNVHVFANVTEGCGIASGASLDCHEATFGWTFEDNLIKGALNVGILLRGQSSSARRNRILYPASHGVLIKSFDTNTDGLLDCEAADNYVLGSGGAGVRIEGTSTCRAKRPRVINNRLYNNSLNNITVLLADDYLIANNDCDGLLSGSANDGNNIRIVGSSTSDRCERGKISGGSCRNSLTRPIRADFANTLDIIDPGAIVAVSPSLFTSCTDAFAWGNRTGFVTPSLASAATLTLTHGINDVYRISGTTVIDTITATNMAGRRVLLIFTSTAGLSELGNIKLNGTTFTATVDDVVGLVSDGTSWYESPPRSVN